MTVHVLLFIFALIFFGFSILSITVYLDDECSIWIPVITMCFALLFLFLWANNYDDDKHSDSKNIENTKFDERYIKTVTYKMVDGKLLPADTIVSTFKN